MNLKVTAALVFVMIGFGAYFYFVEVVQHEAEVKQEEMDSRLHDLNTTAITTIEIARPGEDAIILARDGEEWRINAPMSAEADGKKIDGLLQTLDTSRVDQTLDEIDLSDRSPFGLDPPIVEVTLTDEAGESRSLLMGSNNPTKSFLYAQKGAERPIFLTSASVRPPFEEHVTEYREKSVFKVERSELFGVIFEPRDGPRLEVELREPADWHIIDPREMLADQTAMRTVMDAIANTDAEDFVLEDPSPDELARYGLDNPTVVITALATPDKNPVKLSIGSLKDGDVYYAQREGGPVMEVPVTFFQNINKDLEDLRNKKLANIITTKVRGVRLKNSFGNFEFRNTAGNTWYIVEPREMGGDYSSIIELAQAMNREDASQIIETPDLVTDYGFADPTVAVDFILEDQNISVTFGGTIPDTQNVYAKNSASDEIYVLPETVLEPFQNPLFHFRNKLIFTFQRKDIAKFELKGPNYTATVEKDGDAWRLAQPANRVLEQGKWNSFLSRFGYVYKRDLVRETQTNLIDYGLDPPIYEMTLHTHEGLSDLKLMFGEEIPEENKVYAMSNSSGVVKIDRSLFDSFPKTLSDLTEE